MTPIKRRLLYIFRGPLLRLRVTWPKGNSLTLSTGYRVDRLSTSGKPKWDGSRCVRNTTHGPDATPAAVINRALERLEERIDRAFYSFEQADDSPSPQRLRELLDPESPVASRSISSLVEEYHREQFAVLQWSDRTSRCVRQSLDNLSQTFGASTSIHRLPSDAVARLMDHFTKKKKFVRKHEGEESVTAAGLNNNSINRYLSFIRAFARWTIEKGYVKDSPLLGKTKYLKTVPNPVVFLSMDELSRFMQAARTDSEKETAEAFCFCCFTGLRYSDIADLRWNQVHGDRIEIVTRKTNDHIEIELNSLSKEVLARRTRGKTSERVFRVLSNPNFNGTVKRIAKEAGIDEPVKVTGYTGAKRTDTVLPKWNFITSHTPRKTFVTNALSLGISPAVVMKWTGHKNFKAMRPYIDIVSSARRESMALFDSLPPIPAAGSSSGTASPSSTSPSSGTVSKSASGTSSGTAAKSASGTSSGTAAKSASGTSSGHPQKSGTASENVPKTVPPNSQIADTQH